MAELEVGKLVGANLRLVKPLGHGGMGSVWVADHVALDTRVAVKFILPHLVQRDPTLLKRFRDEARTAAKIDSQHVVAVKDYGITDEEIPYIVMELLRGQSLAHHLERSGPLPLRRTAMIVAQVADVLAAAQSLRVVHRDVKPANIFLVESTYEVFVKVLDFGVAKVPREDASGAGTETGALIGTAEYMSPEQVDGERVDHRADLWSLAVVAYQCLTGRQPFRGKTLGAICVAISRGEFEPVGDVRDDLPVEVDGWFDKALHRDIDRRFTSAREMAEELAKIAEATAADAQESTKTPLELLMDLQPRSSQTDQKETKRDRPARAATPADAHDETLPSDGAADVKSSTFGASTASLASRVLPSRRSGWLWLGVAAVGIGAILVGRTWRPDANAEQTSPAGVGTVAPEAPSPSIKARHPSASATTDPRVSAQPPPATAPSIAGTETPARAAAITLTPRPVHSSRPTPSALAGSAAAMTSSSPAVRSLPPR
jgi:serine/threonine-protein kinase